MAKATPRQPPPLDGFGDDGRLILNPQLRHFVLPPHDESRKLVVPLQRGQLICHMEVDTRLGTTRIAATSPSEKNGISITALHIGQATLSPALQAGIETGQSQAVQRKVIIPFTPLWLPWETGSEVSSSRKLKSGIDSSVSGGIVPKSPAARGSLIVSHAGKRLHREPPAAAYVNDAVDAPFDRRPFGHLRRAVLPRQFQPCLSDAAPLGQHEHRHVIFRCGRHGGRLQPGLRTTLVRGKPGGRGRLGAPSVVPGYPAVPGRAPPVSATTAATVARRFRGLYLPPCGPDSRRNAPRNPVDGVPKGVPKAKNRCLEGKRMASGDTGNLPA